MRFASGREVPLPSVHHHLQVREAKREEDKEGERNRARNRVRSRKVTQGFLVRGTHPLSKLSLSGHLIVPGLIGERGEHYYFSCSSFLDFAWQNERIGYFPSRARARAIFLTGIVYTSSPPGEIVRLCRRDGVNHAIRLFRECRLAETRGSDIRSWFGPRRERACNLWFLRFE